MKNSGSWPTAEADRRRGRSTRRGAGASGSSLLDELRAIPLGLVDGWVPEDVLRRLAGLGDRRRSGAADERADALSVAIGRSAAVERRGAG